MLYFSVLRDQLEESAGDSGVLAMTPSTNVHHTVGRVLDHDHDHHDHHDHHHCVDRTNAIQQTHPTSASKVVIVIVSFLFTRLSFEIVTPYYCNIKIMASFR